MKNEVLCKVLAHILRHPHFLRYLKYFIYGPDLPEPTIRRFYQIVENDMFTSAEVLDHLTAFVRKEVKEKGFDPKPAAEEFFKVAHEAGAGDFAESIRTAAMRVRD